MSRLNKVLFRICLLFILAVILIQIGIWHGRRIERIRWLPILNERNELLDYISDMQKGKPEMKAEKIYIECE